MVIVGKSGLAGIGCAALGVSLAVIPGTAHALSCATNMLTAPAPDQANVPTNALLWGYSLAYTRLLGPSGEVIPLDERALRVAQLDQHRGVVPILVPRGDLQPNTRYTIEVDHAGPGVDRSEFITGAGPAGEPPAPPTLIASEPVIGLSWSSASVMRWVSLEFQSIRERGLILIGISVDPARGGTPEVASVESIFVDDTSLPEEAILEGPTVEWASQDDWVSAGIADCATWPEGAPDAVNGRFGTFDLAGNFSGWADVSLEIPSLAEAEAGTATARAEQAEAAAEAERVAAANRALLADQPSGGACAAAPARAGGGSGLASLALVLAAALRRRR